LSRLHPEIRHGDDGFFSDPLGQSQSLSVARFSAFSERNEAIVRSELVFSAGTRVANRFLLSTIAMRAVHGLHVNSTRVEDTANRVFTDVANGNYVQVVMPEIKPLPPLDPLLLAVAS
jgi:hypothetical protein